MKCILKDFEKFEENEEDQLDKIRLLWQSVVTEAFFSIKTKSKKKDAVLYKLRALKWVNLKNRDFILVCELAGIDPFFVYNKFLKVREDGRPKKFK